MTRRGYSRGHDLLAWAFFAGRRRHVYRRLAAISDAQTGDRVIDIGCGDGYLTRRMAEQVGPTGTVLGIDPSPEAIERARSATPRSNCHFATGVAEELGGSDGRYEVVVTSLAVHHLAETSRPAAFAEMWRVLRPGGRLLVAEFRPPQTRVGRALIRPFASANMQHNPLDQLHDMLTAAGFDHLESGILRPWIYYLRGRKPLDA